MVVLIKKIILKPSATDGFSGEDKREKEREREWTLRTILLHSIRPTFNSDKIWCRCKQRTLRPINAKIYGDFVWSRWRIISVFMLDDCRKVDCRLRWLYTFIFMLHIHKVLYTHIYTSMLYHYYYNINPAPEII